MLRLALLCLVAALLVSLAGFTNVFGGPMLIAKILFFVFIVMFVVLLVFGTRDPVDPNSQS